ncbi:Probable 5'-nucleotidase precursor [Candidatus Ornithobacterium hominis]|uniref:Probable 5'-nucleotidase n=1 Tax=Candidatus Ornithobacterium hominis TaxID=2497989 RepID=A0A383U2E4_9FLAO|nr:metallophosphatase [Candidatus Ornithobacterium hominis]MCT7904567.1 metallophosphatase [Candidatus Ornithobacterium hominis]SZD74092.1 Probable 5'-nucleotidase precursor [Candidatus Ornithobacterium hominis]
MRRRHFIQQSLAATAFATLPAMPAWAKSGTKRLSILHTNDQHSRIEPFETSENEKYSNRGGFARRATLIERIRAQEKNVLLLDAGDIFQGTPYFNFFGGELEFKLMSQMKYDACTMGNHDFDNGLQGFEKQLKHADFSFICSNYDFRNTILEGKTKAYQIFEKDGIRVGVFGLGIDFAGLVPKDLYQETQYLNPVEIAQEMTQKLKEKHCDLIICLSHLGFKYDSSKIDDSKLAQQTKDIDLIIGGHTHTFLPAPVEMKNTEGKTVLINQVGWGGLNLGKIDFEFSLDKKQKYYSAKSLPITPDLV